MLNVKIFILMLASLFLCACAGGSMQAAARPAEGNYRTALRNELSVLNVPLEATSEQFANVLGRLLPKELYKGPVANKISGLTVRLLRNGVPSASGTDNYLHIVVPISMSFSFGMFTTQEIPLKLKFKLNATVAPDWKIITDVHYTGISELLAEEIGIGVLSVKPRNTVDGLVRPLQKLLSDAVSRSINEKINLKAVMESTWREIQQPILLDQTYHAWLKITPREVALQPFYARNNLFRISSGITASAELVVGARPAVGVPAALPPLKVLARPDRNFRIALNMDLPYRDIQRIATPLLLGKDFGTDGKSTIITSFDLYGSGDRIIIRIETRGSLEGTFYLNGKPHFDQESGIFSVSDVDFDMSTRDLLARTADWFLHGAIRSVIQSKLDVSMAQQLKDVREMLQKSVTRVQLHDHLILKGAVTTLKIRSLSFFS